MTFIVRISLFLSLTFLGLSSLKSQELYFEYSELAIQAYDEIISLRFKDSRITLDALKKEEPSNLVFHHLENYIDFLKVFINEEETQFRKLESNKSFRLDQIKKGPKESPYYLFVQAEIQLQWALARLKFEEYLAAFSEVSKAYKQLEQNREMFPEFIGNNKSLGIIHALIGTIPDNYKWGIKLLGGMEGSIMQGKKEIEEVLHYASENKFIFEQETIFMYAFLLLHLENEEEQAWQMVSTEKLKTVNSPLACFAKANVAMRTGRSEVAIEILESRPKGEAYHAFHYLDLILGFAKLYRLDKDADQYIESYIDHYRGKNYLKEAHQKLAWYYLLEGNSYAYKNNMRLCLLRGDNILDSDKTALREAKEKLAPNANLLKSRLLFDGGYYQRAYDVLLKVSDEDKNVFSNKLEYTYRLGRVLHRLERYDEALENYILTIDTGRTTGYFYACNAALQCGLIHEKEKEFEKAKFYFDLCLELKPDNYKVSLHQKAETGLNRLETILGF